MYSLSPHGPFLCTRKLEKLEGHDSHHYREIVPRYGYDAVACEQTLQIGIGLWRFETVQEGECDGSTERCLDCPVESQCPYSAKKIYLQRRQFLYVFDIPDNDCKNHKYDSLILDKLRTSDYGRCVYRCDNDQCDHFVASLEFDNNITGAFSMEAFTATGGRLTRVMGTKGWIEGDMKKFTVTDFLTNKKLVWNKDISSLPGYEGHAGGDFGIVKDFVLAVAHRDASYLTSTIDLSIESHVMGFLAEKSRVLKKRIDM